jgi:DNA-binding response OmpR family regulator
VGHDDAERRALERRLAADGYGMRSVGDLATAIAAIQTAVPDAVVMITHRIGPVCGEASRRVREFSRVPLLLVCLDASGSHVASALTSGADDHIQVDATDSELGARVQALIRRNQLSPYLQDDEIEVGPLRIDCRRAMCAINGDAVRLTPREFKLLRALALQPNAVLKHDELIEQVWGSPYHASAENLRKLMQRLRTSLGALERGSELIISVHGFGYYLSSETLSLAHANV